MPRPDVVRLREDPNAAPEGASVIDANFTAVDRSSLRSRLWRFSLALMLAALIGALAPIGLLMAAGVFNAFS